MDASSFQTLAYDRLHHHEVSGEDGHPQYPSHAWSKLLDRSPDAEVKGGFQNTTKGTSKPTKLNTAKLSTTSHRESFELEMDSALAQWEEKENLTPDEKWAALQQVVYNTAKTYLGKPDRKHQDWFDPEDQELQTLMSRRDQAHQRVLQTRSTRSTTAAYKDACRLLQKHTRALKSDWWERKAVELQTVLTETT